MICVHHNDLDGVASAAIVNHFVGEDIDFICMDYDKEFTWDSVVQGSKVVMVDFCLEPFSDMVRLSELAGEFVWLDHHKGAITEYKKYLQDGGKAFDGLISDETKDHKHLAGCELTWDFYCPSYQVTERPEFITLLGRYDVWDHGAHPDIIPFQYGMRHNDLLDPEAPIWEELFDAQTAPDLIAKTVNNGYVIIEYVAQNDRKIIEAGSFVIEDFCGYRCLACNAIRSNSKVFDSIWDPEKYDIMMPFYLNKDGNWKVSLYATDNAIDVSVIAKKFDGGGHKHAAGFIAAPMPSDTGVQTTTSVPAGTCTFSLVPSKKES